MTKQYTLILFFTFITSLLYSQNKKDLTETIIKLRSDSNTLGLTVKKNNLIIDSLNKEIFNTKELNTVLQKEYQTQLQEFQKMKELIKEEQAANKVLYDSIETLQKSLNLIKDQKITSQNKQIEQISLRNDSLINQLNELRAEKIMLTKALSDLNKRFDSLLLKITELNIGDNNTTEYYTIEDQDGYSNLRELPGGKIIREVYNGEKFEVIGEENNYKKVKFSNSSTGYIHNSRIVNFNIKICECLNAANELIKKNLDKDFSLGSKTGFPDNWEPTFTERLLGIFRYNLSPKGCDFLGDENVIDFKSEIQRCIR